MVCNLTNRFHKNGDITYELCNIDSITCVFIVKDLNPHIYNKLLNNLNVQCTVLLRLIVMSRVMEP